MIIMIFMSNFNAMCGT